MDSYLQGPKQVKDRKNCKKKWRGLTNNIPFLKLFFPKGSDHPKGHFWFVVMIAHVGGVHQDPTTGAGGSGGSHQLSGAALRRAGREVNDSRTSCSSACYARQGATRQLLASLSDTDALITNNLDEEVQRSSSHLPS